MVTMKEDELFDIVFIAIPEAARRDFDGFCFDPDILLPVQLTAGSRAISPNQGISIEMIGSGLIRMIARRPEHPHFAYYCKLLTALYSDAAHELQVAGIAKAKNHDYDFAEELFLACCHLDPHTPEQYVNLSVLYGQQAKEAMDANDQQRYDQCITKQLAILRKGLEVNPDSIVLLSEFGMLNLYLGNDEIAVEYLQQYLRLAPEDEKKTLIADRVRETAKRLENNQALYGAFDEMQLGHYEQALSLANTFVRNNPKTWEGWFIKGWACRCLGDYADAQKSFLRCLELGEKNADIYNELSLCALEMGNKELSKNYLEIAVDLDDENVKLLTNLAFLHLRDDEYNEAYELLLRARSIDPNDPMVQRLGEKVFAKTDGEDNDAIGV